MIAKRDLVLERMLKKTENRLKDTLSSMVDLVFAFDEDARFIFCHSPQPSDLYVPPEKFIGKKHSEVMPPHINELFEEAFKKIKKGEIAEYEYYIEIKGKVRWFTVKLSSLFYDHQFAGSVAVAREITERKEQEEKLKRNMEQLENLAEERTAQIKAINKQLQRNIIEHKKTDFEREKLLKTLEIAREAITITSEDGRMIYTNKAMDELFGYEEGELKGKHPSILNAKSKSELVTAQIMNQIREEGYWEGEIHNQKKDGTEFLSYARISVLKDKEGKIINFLSTQHNITESKRMKETLRQSEEKYRILYDSSKDGIVYSDIDGNILDANQAYQDMLGYTIEELRKITYQELTPSKWHEMEEDIVRKQLKATG